MFFSFMTDQHIAAIPPRSRTDEYWDSILQKIQQVKGWTQRNKGICLCGGDLFHVKSPISPSNPLWLINRTMEILREFPTGRVYGVVGNHDVRFDRIQILEEQPLGVLAQAGVYEVLPPSTIYEGEGFTVEVVAFDYDTEIEVLKKILTLGPRTTTYRVGVAHAMARLGGSQDLFGHPIIGYDLLEDIDFDVFLWGHDHSYIPPTEVGRCTHIHPGSLSRASLNTDESERPVRVAGLKFEADGWGYVEKELVVGSLDEVFRVADQGVVKANSSPAMQAFSGGLKESLAKLTAKDPSEILDNLCAGDQGLRELIREVSGS